MSKRMTAARRARRAATACAAALMVVLAAGGARAEGAGYTREAVDEWLRHFTAARPDFKPGDLLGAGDLERIRPFIPPGYLDQLNFPGFRMQIIASRGHTPRADFTACTEKYQPQVRLNSDGTLADYICGQPFADAALDPRHPGSGLRAAWNFEYRWQNYGQVVLNSTYALDRFGGKHSGDAMSVAEPPPQEWLTGLTYHSKLPADAWRSFGGGGTFERVVSSFFQRVYFSHLAPLADKGAVLALPAAKDFVWKEFTGFISPFDVRGTVIIDYRYSDPHRADDAWSYDPKLRRVRRISVEVKADSLAGTDLTIEDFYTFSGRPLDWNWKFLGWKRLLSVMDSKGDYARLDGPNGTIPDDLWSVRRFAVVERAPKRATHPYSSVVMFWDAENWHPWLGLAFDREKKLLKVWAFQQRWTEDFKSWAEFNHGVDTTVIQSIVAFDVQKNRATVICNYGEGYPNVTLDRVTHIFDISELEEVHR